MAFMVSEKSVQQVKGSYLVMFTCIITSSHSSWKSMGGSLAPVLHQQVQRQYPRTTGALKAPKKKSTGCPCMGG